MRNVQKGSALVYALGLISAILIITVSVMRFVMVQVDNGYAAHSRNEAFQIAESGIYFYRWYLAHQTDAKTAQQVQDFWNSSSPYPLGLGTNSPYEQEYRDTQGGSIGKYSITVTPPNSYSTIVTVTSRGWTYKHPEMVRSVQVRFRRPSWSEFSILSNDFTRFGSGWDVSGKIMSNTGIDFNGIAHNEVDAGLASYFNTDWNKTLPGVYSHDWQPSNYNSDQNSEVFLGGKNFPIAQKDFNGLTVDLGAMKILSMSPNNGTINGCTATGCHFASSGVGKHIILKSSGQFDIKTVTATYVSNGTSNSAGKIKTETSAETYDIPQNGVIFVDGDLWVEGTVSNKRITIVAANIPTTGTNANIYIGTNNIQYTYFDGRDVIGLISQGDIETIHDGLNNLTIDAALLAQNGMVGGKDRNPNCCSATCAGLKNNVSFFGSIASKQRMAILIGRVKCNANSNLYGYLNRNIAYDNNLLYFPPPYFPTGTEYSIDLWEEL